MMQSRVMQSRVMSSMCLAAALAVPLGFGVPAFGGPRPAPGDVAPSASDALLDPVQRDSTAGIALRPPIGAIVNRQLGTSEIVRFVYPDKGWTLVVKETPNASHLLMASNPDVPGDKGLLDVAASQFTERGGVPAQVIRKEVVIIGPRPVGLIEARDKVGIEPLFVQVALIPADRGRFFTLQMTVKGQSPEGPAREAFQRTLATVEVLDRAAVRQDQDRRLANTRWLWLQLDQRAVEKVLQPVHFMRVVRDGRDAGYVQVNERAERHHGWEGVYLVSRQHVDVSPSEVAPAAAPAPGTATPGLNVPRPGAANAAGAPPTQVDRDARFFFSFDRAQEAHEDWTAIDRIDNRAGNDLIEMGNSDLVLKRALDRSALTPRGVPIGKSPDKQPPVTTRPVYTLRVDNYRGKAPTAPTLERPLPPYYLPQGLAQLLPRLLPIDQPKQYMFAFYVGAQRQLLYRYVDVGVEREAELDGRKVRAIPVTDRIGADGVVTTHYVSRDDDQWLGTVSDDGRLQVLPTDESTLKSTWKTFDVLPDPVAPVENDVPRRDPRDGPVLLDQIRQGGPRSNVPPPLDSGGFGGR